MLHMEDLQQPNLCAHLKPQPARSVGPSGPARWRVKGDLSHEDAQHAYLCGLDPKDRLRAVLSGRISEEGEE